MLKHMLNGNASAVGADRHANAIRQSSSSSSLHGSRNLLSTVQQQQQQQQQQQFLSPPPSSSSSSLPQPQQAQSAMSQQQSPPPLPSPLQHHRLQLQQHQPDGVGNDLSGRLRVTTLAPEPEYQNTTRVRSSPTCEFYRGLPPGKSVRSLEDVMAMCEPDPSRANRRPPPPLDPQWMASMRGKRAEPPHHAQLRSRSSLLNHSYAGYSVSGAPHPFAMGQQQQQQQQLLSPSHRSRLNHSDVVPSLTRTATTSPIFTPIANGPTKPIANGGLHIPKRSPLGSVTPPPNANDIVKTDSSTDVSREGGRRLRAGYDAAAAASKDGDDDDDDEEEEGEEQEGRQRRQQDGRNRRIADANRAAAAGVCRADFSVSGGGGGGNGDDMFSNGVKEILTSLGLLCLISLLLALLSLIFLLKISPVTAADVKDLLRAEQFTIVSPDEYVTVYEVTLALCALSLSLNLCCLLVCSVQFLFAVKLTRASVNGDRTNKYLQKSAVTRVCAIAGFFISIPVFLTGVILYTFIQFHSTPAIVTSVLIGSGIVFCGCAMVHNVFVWQKEKTNAVKALVREQRLCQRTETSKDSTRGCSGGRGSRLEPAGAKETNAIGGLSSGSTLAPHAATIDVGSVTSTLHELSTLV